MHTLYTLYRLPCSEADGWERGDIGLGEVVREEWIWCHHLQKATSSQTGMGYIDTQEPGMYCAVVHVFVDLTYPGF